jgi:cell division protein FtsW
MTNLVSRIKDRLEGDKVIWMVALILSVASLLSVYSSISSLAVKAGGNSTKFLTKQGILLLMGLCVIYIVHRINYKYFARLAYVVYGLAVIALILTLVVGSDINDAKRWLEIPFVGLTLQTSDFAKVALVMWVAKELHLRREYLDDFRNEVVPILLRIALVCGLILPADLSTALLLGAVSVGMLLIGGVPWSGLFRVGGIVVALGLGLYGVGKSMPDLFPRFGTWTNRIEQHIGFTTSGADRVASEGEYQIELAQVAIHNGGLFPSGPGTGTSRNFLPHPYSDMIYAFIIEEWGAIIGGMGLLLIYLILLYRTILAAKNCDRPFGSYLAMGLGMMITIQAFINMAVAVRLFPTTGQPLPLVSYGGTSILFTCLSIGMILAISRAPQLSKKR